MIFSNRIYFLKSLILWWITQQTFQNKRNTHFYSFKNQNNLHNYWFARKFPPGTFIDFPENVPPACLFRPTRLMFSKNFPPCTFILPYTSIRHTRVLVWLKDRQNFNFSNLNVQKKCRTGYWDWDVKFVLLFRALYFYILSSRVWKL